MIRNHSYRRRRRRGIVLVESALVYSSTLMLVLGTMSFGLGVFRYQEMSWLSREGARWAAVHGSTYQTEQSQSAPTSSSVLTNAIYPRMVVLTQANLSCTLTMTSGVATVTLTYNWTPEVYFSPITLKSTSAVPIFY